MINSFAIFKNDKKERDGQPDYRLSAKIDDKYVDLGAGWAKTSANGTKFISVQLSKPYQDKKGWEIKEIGDKQEEIQLEDVFPEPEDESVPF